MMGFLRNFIIQWIALAHKSWLMLGARASFWQWLFIILLPIATVFVTAIILVSIPATVNKSYDRLIWESRNLGSLPLSPWSSVFVRSPIVLYAMDGDDVPVSLVDSAMNQLAKDQVHLHSIYIYIYFIIHTVFISSIYTLLYIYIYILSLYQV
jgi:hypothetical protein